MEKGIELSRGVLIDKDDYFKLNKLKEFVFAKGLWTEFLEFCRDCESIKTKEDFKKLLKKISKGK